MNTTALASALGIVFGTGTSLTSSHKVPFFNGTTPAGLATMSDLASVLGVVDNGKLTPISNIDEGVNSGFWIGNGSTQGTLPTTAEGFVLLINGNSDYVGQIAIGAESNSVWHRSKLNRTGYDWSSWVRMYDETILNNSTILGQLASALGVIKWFDDSYVSDYNDLTNNGLYYIKDDHSQNKPTATGWYYAIVIHVSVNITQIVIPDNRNAVYIRFYSNSSWTDWKEL